MLQSAKLNPANLCDCLHFFKIKMAYWESVSLNRAGRGRDRNMFEPLRRTPEVRGV